MDKQITIYHGSEQIVEIPTFGKGKKNNDFGLGFYCTESEDLAKEWAVSSLRNGFSNRYTLDTEYLNILNLNSPDYTILNWIAVLVEHRLFSIKTPVAHRAKRYLIDNFSVNVNAFDLSHLHYEGFDIAEKEQYYVLRKARDDEANQLYFDMLEEENDGLYIQDIIRGGIKNDDSRIPRNLSE